MWSYGAGHEEGQLPLGLSAEVQRLAVLKAKSVSRGDLRGAKKYEYQLKKLMHQHGVLYKGDFAAIIPDAGVQRRMVRVRLDRLKALGRHEVPSWFRPGYDDRLRLRLWLRLSRRFRNFLLQENEAGRLSVYMAAPSYWAKVIRPSDFYIRMPPAEVEAVVAETANGSVQDAVVVAEVVDAQAAEVADLEQATLAEEVEDQVLVETLEQPGSGVLATEAPWYDDPLKVVLAVAGGLMFLRAVQR